VLQEEIYETFDVIGEMTADPGGMVTLDPALVSQITAGDDDPRFATFVIESGWSKSNRFWGAELFQDVAVEMTRAANGGDPIVGYMGHIKPEDDPFTFPEIQLQWVGAKLLQAGDKAKLAVKAYVLPGTKGKDYLKRGLVKSVSWRGKVAQEKFEKGVRIKQFAIESIDLSRPRAAGMSARLVGALTSEMEIEGGNSVKPEEIAALQENELRAHNSGLVATIEASARKPLEDQVSEMETEAKATAPVLDLVAQLRKILNLGNDEDDVSVLTKGVTEIRSAAKAVRAALIDNAIAKKIKGDSADAVLARRLIVGEMKDKEISLTGDDEADEKTVGEMVNTIIDSEDRLKEIVSEMEDLPATPPSTSKTDRDASPRELKAGFKNSRITVRSAG
jgi:hypothetical protein